jgi:hypothetical protein
VTDSARLQRSPEERARNDPAPLDGAIIFSDLIGKLGMPRIERAKCELL